MAEKPRQRIRRNRNVALPKFLAETRPAPQKLVRLRVVLLGENGDASHVASIVLGEHDERPQVVLWNGDAYLAPINQGPESVDLRFQYTRAYRVL